MKTKFLTLLSIMLFVTSSVFSADDIKEFKIPEKTVDKFTKTELIYVASFLFGHQLATSYSQSPEIVVNFEKFLEGFEKRLKDKTLELAPKDITVVNIALKALKEEKKSPSKEVTEKLFYMQGIINAKKFSSSLIALDKTAFVLGIQYVKNKKEFKFDEKVKKAIYDRMEILHKEEAAKAQKKATENRTKEQLEALAKEKIFFEKNAKKEGIISLENGLQYKVIKKGSGAVFAKGQTAKVHYEGRLLDGTVFDSSYKRGQPYPVAYKGQVIRGWQEILALMKVGDKWEVYIPSPMGYGPRGSGRTIKANATLIFKMEVMSIK